MRGSWVASWNTSRMPSVCLSGVTIGANSVKWSVRFAGGTGPGSPGPGAMRPFGSSSTGRGGAAWNTCRSTSLWHCRPPRRASSPILSMFS